MLTIWLVRLLMIAQKHSSRQILKTKNIATKNMELTTEIEKTVSLHWTDKKKCRHHYGKIKLH